MRSTSCCREGIVGPMIRKISHEGQGEESCATASSRHMQLQNSFTAPLLHQPQL